MTDTGAQTCLGFRGYEAIGLKLCVSRKLQKKEGQVTHTGVDR